MSIDDSSTIDDSCFQGVQLGFAEPIQDNDRVSHESPNWMDHWDGGHVGGKPSWLNPRDLPSVNWATCPTCDGPLKFLCQLYAPALHAFHRTLYVFGCHATIRVLRTQLPRENEFYPYSQDDLLSSDDWKKHTPSYWNVSLCQVCGQRGKGKCPLQGVSFCGRKHQVEHKKHVFQSTADNVFLPSVFAKHELVVEEEPPPFENEKERKTLFNNDDLEDDLNQEDLNQMTGSTGVGTKDPVTLEFYTRIGRPNNAQEQCLRYCQWPNENNNDDDDSNNSNIGPLWIASHGQPTTIPPCPYCGARRKFEFQLQPQMLYHLLKNHRNTKTKANEDEQKKKQALLATSAILEKASANDNKNTSHSQQVAEFQEELFKKQEGEMDWGVVAVYTCTNSCSIVDLKEELGAYREEYAWRQAPLEEMP